MRECTDIRSNAINGLGTRKIQTLLTRVSSMKMSHPNTAAYISRILRCALPRLTNPHPGHRCDKRSHTGIYPHFAESSDELTALLSSVKVRRIGAITRYHPLICQRASGPGGGRRQCRIAHSFLNSPTYGRTSSELLVMMTSSLLPRAAWRVQLNEPQTSTSPSTTANL